LVKRWKAISANYEPAYAAAAQLSNAARRGRRACTAADGVIPCSLTPDRRPPGRGTAKGARLPGILPAGSPAGERQTQAAPGETPVPAVADPACDSSAPPPVILGHGLSGPWPFSRFVPTHGSRWGASRKSTLRMEIPRIR